MADMSYMDPIIEIVATRARLKIIAARLCTGAIHPCAAGDMIDFGSTDPLLVDMASVGVVTLERCQDACPAGYARSLIILDTANTRLLLSDTITIRQGRDIVRVKGRLTAMARRDRPDDTGLFSRRFLQAHLERQMVVADTYSQALSIMALKPVGDRRAGENALAPLARCVQGLVGKTDFAAAVEPGTLAVSLPLTTYRGGVELARRMAARVAQEHALSGPGLTWRVIDMRAFHTAQTFLEAAPTGPFMRLQAS